MRLLVFIATITLCLVVSSAVLPWFEQAPKPDGSLSFLVIGDWGRRGAYNQSEVAVQMGVIGERLDIDFVISTGDNFYDNGLRGIDDASFDHSFTKIYTAPSLQKQWYSVLGNHDYRGNVEAQLSLVLTNLDKRWFCSRSYVVNAEVAEFFFVDTTPFVDKYFTEPEDHVYDWRGMWPRRQYISNLLKEVDLALKLSNAKWKIVVGHHTIRSVGHHGDTKELVNQLLPILEANKIDLFINGHDHCLQHISSLDSKFGITSPDSPSPNSPLPSHLLKDMSSGGRGDDTHRGDRKGKAVAKDVAPRRRRTATRIIQDVGRFFSFGSTSSPSVISSTQTTTAPIAPEAPVQHGTEVPTHQASTSVGIPPGSHSATPSPSDDEDNVDNEGLLDVSDDEVVMSPDGKVVITPAGTAFLPSKPASKAITAVIKETYNRPWTTWGQIKKNEADRSMMLKAFNDKCMWLPEHHAEVERIFHHRAARRLSDMLREARLNAEDKDKGKPDWIGEHAWDVLRRHWASEPFKKVSDRHKTNRASEKGGALHTGGSVNTAHIRQRLEKQLRRPVSVAELHRLTHTRRGTGDYIDERSRRTQEQFKTNMTQYWANSGTSNDGSNPDEVSRVELQNWVNVAGGKKKGRLYGAGSLSSCYRPGVSRLDINASSSSGGSTGRSYIPSDYLEVQRQLQIALHEAREAKKGQEDLRTEVREIKQFYLEILQQGARPPPQPYPQTQPYPQPYPYPQAHPHAQPYPQAQPPLQPQSQAQPPPQYGFIPPMPQPQHSLNQQLPQMQYGFWPLSSMLSQPFHAAPAAPVAPVASPLHAQEGYVPDAPIQQAPAQAEGTASDEAANNFTAELMEGFNNQFPHGGNDDNDYNGY